MWLEVYRVAENQLLEPDCLANHNSGSAEGDVTFLTGVGTSGRFFNFSSSPRVRYSDTLSTPYTIVTLYYYSCSVYNPRYCVEIEKVDLTDIPRTPSGPVEFPTNYSFSEYLSCNGNRHSPDPYQQLNYTCICDNHIDRVIAHQSPEQLEKYCNGTGATENDCHCDPGSIKWSTNYTGIMPVALPWAAHHGPPVPTPAPSPLVHYGDWYHHPAATKCAVGFGEETVGTAGCTWRRHQAAFMGYGPDFLNAGWLTNGTSNDVVKSNTAAFHKVFNGLAAGRCCGC
jgi:hypothetical protein